MRMTRTLGVMAAAGVMAGAVGMARADLLGDPGFDGALTSATSDPWVNAASSAVQGKWMVADDAWAIQGGAAVAKNGAGSNLSQFVKQPADGTYTLSFDYKAAAPDLVVRIMETVGNEPGAGYPWPGVKDSCSDNGWEGNNGAQYKIFDTGAIAAASDWTHYSLNFDASGINATSGNWGGHPNQALWIMIRQESGSASDGVMVDNVSLTPIPEPASLGLLGLGALAMLRRRRA